MPYQRIIIMNCEHPVESVEVTPVVQDFWTDESPKPVATHILSETGICTICKIQADIKLEEYQPL